MKRLAIISDLEKHSPVFHAMYPEIFTDFDKVVTVSELRHEPKSRFAVNRVLEPHFRAVHLAEDFDYVLSTALFGLPYFLLQSFPGIVEVYSFDMLGLRIPIGKIFNESEITRLELEEELLRQYANNFIKRSGNTQIYIDHFYGNDFPAPAIGQGGMLSKNIAATPFIFLPQGRMKSEKGLTLKPREYVLWAKEGKIPGALIEVDLSARILVDEGNDHLELGNMLNSQKSIGAALLALDQKRPSQTAFPGQIPCYGNSAWLDDLIDMEPKQYTGWGDIMDFCAHTDRTKIPNPCISVILVHHNRPNFIGQCLQGFAKQTFKNFDIVLIDNGSDNLPDLTEFPELCITLVKNKNTYPGFARNLGAEISSAEYVVFFDDDNVPMANMLEKMYQVTFDTNPDYVTCFRRTFLDSLDGPAEDILSAPNLKHSAILRNYLGDTVFLMRRKTFLKIRFTDYYAVGREDFEFIHTANAMGFTGHVIPMSLYHYRMGNDDKIGHRHLTHRTGSQWDYDFGAFRKYRRASQSYAQTKLLQLMENYHVQHRAGRPYRVLFGRLRACFRRISYRLPSLRRLYNLWVMR